jgi:hypothetical protein
MAVKNEVRAKGYGRPMDDPNNWLRPLMDVLGSITIIGSVRSAAKMPLREEANRSQCKPFFKFGQGEYLVIGSRNKQTAMLSLSFFYFFF